MNTTTPTVATGVLTASALYVGWWASLAPRSFYDSFPGLNRMWVGGDGPYNEHLVRDIGGLGLSRDRRRREQREGQGVKRLHDG